VTTTVAQRVLGWCNAWNEDHPWDHNAHHHDWILRRLPPQIDRALDVGCGTGDLARRLGRRARHVDGVDLDQATIRTAQHLTDPASGIDFTCGDVLEVKLRPGFDAITALAVLHHMPFQPALQRLRDLLTPGGILIVLGVYREQTLTDRLLSTAAVPANLLVGAVKAPRRRTDGTVQRPASMTAPSEAATMTLAQIREVVDRQIPGAVIRRHLFWRYSLVYRAPRTPPG
jgi:2-polyprenyl-3-methyl-5-hydroxy-6-metoxy-1,4-benzoquinol methylase